MVFPPILAFAGIFGSSTLSNIEYLAVQEFNGNLKDNDGSVTTTGTIATLTAGASKDLYLATAKISWRRASGSATEQLVVNLLQNAVAIETFQVNATLSDYGNYEFKNIGGKVDATQVIEINLATNGSNNYAVRGEISGIEVADGVSPRL